MTVLGLVTLLAGCDQRGSQPSDGAPAADPQPTPSSLPSVPFVRVLGTAQDGGFPHVACDGPHCRKARKHPNLARRVASLALVTGTDEIYLIDATPDLPEQLEALADVRTAPTDRVDRDPVRGVFLTHAHLGHYTGLAHFGFEAVHTQGLELFATPRMLSYLKANGPWSQLFALNNLTPHELVLGEPVELGSVTVEPFLVPHRDEFSDTVAFIVRGPNRSLLYVPDTDRWETWDQPLTEVLETVDIALLDGSFFSLDELPGRSLEEIPHPLVRSTMALLRTDERHGTDVYFTHFNHSNPAVDPQSTAWQEIQDHGFHVLADGQQFDL